MTEKRFTLVKCYNQNWGLVDKSLEDLDQLVLIHTNKSSVLYLVNELNHLVDKNEQLRHDATVLIQANIDYRKENEELKKDVEYWKQVASQYSNELNVFEHNKRYKTECKDIYWDSD